MNIADCFYLSRSEVRVFLIILFISGAGFFILNYSSLRSQQKMSGDDVPVPADSTGRVLAALPDTSGTIKEVLEIKTEARNKPERRKFVKPYASGKYPAGTVVELNAADTASLKRVPGIGSTFAHRIVGFRNLLGGFYCVGQLREVYGIDEQRYSSLEPWFRVDTAGITPLQVNHLSYGELVRHPYLSKAQARILCQLRMRKGRLNGWEELMLLQEFDEEARRKLAPYISFE